MNNDIKILSLLNGQELIAEIQREDLNQIELIHPFLFFLEMERSTNNPKLGLIPYGPLVDGNILINKNMIIYIANPKEMLLTAYRQSTGKIITHRKELIVG